MEQLMKYLWLKLYFIYVRLFVKTTHIIVVMILTSRPSLIQPFLIVLGN